MPYIKVFDGQLVTNRWKFEEITPYGEINMVYFKIAFVLCN